MKKLCLKFEIHVYNMISYYSPLVLLAIGVRAQIFLVPVGLLLVVGEW